MGQGASPEGQVAVDSGFEWIASLKDGIGKPAREGKAALHGLGDEIKKTEAELKKLQLLQLQYRERGGNWKGIASQVGIEASRIKLHLADLNKAHKGSMNVEKGFFKEFSGSLIPEIAIGELVAEGVKKIGEGIGELVKFSVEVAEFKENTVSAYEVLGKGGQAMFAEIDALAHNIHMPAQEAHALAQDLLTRGMEDDKMIAATIGAISAAKRGGPAGTSEKIQGIVERALSVGKLSVRGPRELAGTGINVEAFYADLGQRLGKSRDVIKEELKAGAIDAKVGIAAIDDAINNGKIGEIAKKKLTFGDLVTDLKNNVVSIFQNVDTGPLVQGFQHFVSLFDTGQASGKGMQDAITGGLNEIIKWIGRGMDAFTTMFLKTEIGAYDLYISLFPVIEVLDKIVIGAGKMVDEWNKLGSGESRIDKALLAGSDMADPMQGLGFDAGKAFGTGLDEGAGAGLDAHSPSRKFMKRGMQMDEGLSAGLDAGMAQESLAASIEPPSAGGGSRGGSSTSVTIDVGGITIQAMNGEEIAPLLESQVIDIFERVALELGG